MGRDSLGWHPASAPFAQPFTGCLASACGVRARTQVLRILGEQPTLSCWGRGRQ